LCLGECVCVFCNVRLCMYGFCNWVCVCFCFVMCVSVCVGFVIVCVYVFCNWMRVYVCFVFAFLYVLVL